jgi:hypothetical protein
MAAAPQVEVVHGLRQWQLPEQRDEVAVGFYSISLSLFDLQVEVGTRVRTADCFGEQPTAPVYAKRLDRVLYQVGVQWPGAVAQEPHELRPLPVQVVQRLAQQA